MREAKERGTDIERCCDGLPTNLRMPNADIQPDQSSSSSHHHGAGSSEMMNPETNAQRSGIPWSSATEANARRESTLGELLRELAVEGIDPPLLTTPNETRTPHGELPKLNSTKNIGATESQTSPLEPCDAPPGIQRGPAEREEFKAYYAQSASVFLSYFQN